MNLPRIVSILHSSSDKSVFQSSLKKSISLTKYLALICSRLSRKFVVISSKTFPISISARNNFFNCFMAITYIPKQSIQIKIYLPEQITAFAHLETITEVNPVPAASSKTFFILNNSGFAHMKSASKNAPRHNCNPTKSLDDVL